MFNRLVLFLVVLFQLSCEANNPTPEIEKDDSNPKKVILQKVVVSTTNLLSDESNVELIYPGNIIKLDTSKGKGRLTVENFTNYTPLPVRVLSLSSIGTLDEIPSYKKTQEFSKELQSKIKGIESTSISQWSAVEDYRILNNIHGMNSDLIAFIKLLQSESGNSIVPNNKNAVVAFGKYIDFSIIMELPKKSELISKEEHEKYKKDALYYINQSNYGSKYIILAEGENKVEELKGAFNRLKNKETLSADDIRVLERSTMSVLLRTSAYKEALVEKSKGYTAIQKLCDKLIERINDKENNYKYPIAFYARSLDDFSLFQYEYTNSFYMAN